MDNFGFQTSQGGGTSGIGGSGTTNYVSKFTAASTIGDSQIFDNGTNVGINNNIPSAKLDILGIDVLGTTYSLKINDSVPNNLFSVRNDGFVFLGSSVKDSYLWLQSAGGVLGLSNENGFANIRTTSTKLFFANGSAGGNAFAQINPSNGNWLLGNPSTNVFGANLTDTKLYIQGVDATASNFALKVENSAINALFSIRNDGIIQTGTQGNYSLKIGNSTGSFGSGAANNSFGYACLSSLTSGSNNTAFGYTNLASVTTGINNTAFGYLCLRTITTQSQNAAFGDNSGELFVGNFNSTFGSISLQNGTGDLNCAFGYGSLNTNGAKNYNVAFGAYSGLNNVGDRNVFLGTHSGYRQTNVSNKLFVDNQDRTSAALELTNSLIVGTFDSVPNNQLIRFNASVGLSVDATAKLHIKGIDATSSNYALKIDNSTPTNLFSIRNDGVVDIYGTITPRLQSLVSSATVTPTNLNDEVVITAQAVGLTLANPTGTAVQGQSMIIRIKDNGTAQTIAYDTQYRAIGVTLPTTTVINKIVYLGLIYNSTDVKWDCIGVSQEA